MKKNKIKVISILAAILTVAMAFTGCSNSAQKTTVEATKSILSLVAIKSDKDLPTSDIFKSEKIADNILRIHGMGGELMYLVEGTDKAALIDTGSGVGKLREYVEKITSKPIIVILTHGHVDHALGAADFDEVYMNHADDAVYAEHSKLAVRKDYIESQNKDGFAKLKETDYVKQRPASDYKDLKPGDSFNLGGTTLEIYNAAGHTPGQIAILFKEQRILMTGDAANYLTFLFDKYSLGITSYEKNMKDLLAKTDGKFDKILISHLSGDAPKELLADTVKLCGDIKAGKVDDVPFEFMGQKACLAKKFDDSFKRVDGGIVNIVYDKEKVNQ